MRRLLACAGLLAICAAALRRAPARSRHPGRTTLCRPLQRLSPCLCPGIDDRADVGDGRGTHAGRTRPARRRAPHRRGTDRAARLSQPTQPRTGRPMTVTLSCHATAPSGGRLRGRAGDRTTRRPMPPCARSTPPSTAPWPPRSRRRRFVASRGQRVLGARRCRRRPPDSPPRRWRRSDSRPLVRGRRCDGAACRSTLRPRARSALGDAVTAAMVQAVTEGLALARYAFTRYRSRPTPAAALTVALQVPRLDPALREAVRVGEVAATATNLARDLANTPAADLVPMDLARAARASPPPA